MDFKPPRNTVATGPEAQGSKNLKKFMEARGWKLMKLHGGKYQSGWPDYVAMHLVHGMRWIEMKAPGGKLRPSQVQKFNTMTKYGQEVYVLRDEKDYHVLNGKGNWLEYVRHRTR